MRAIVCSALLLSCFSAYAEYFVSTEYRTEKFEDEEKDKSFFRGNTSLKIDKARGAGCTVVLFPEEKNASCTWHVKAAREDWFYMMLGNYYTQFGSGLLSGRVKPYIPDPFEEEKEIVQKEVFKECVSGYPSYSYNGVSLSFCGEKNSLFSGIYAFGSRAPRYFREDYYHASDSSFSSILGNISKEKEKRELVYADSAGGMIRVSPNTSISFELSSVYCALKNTSNEAVKWSTGVQGGCQNNSGVSLYGAYNDGAVSVFSEIAENFQKWKNDNKKYSIRSAAWQGKACFKSERLILSAAVKRIGENYSLPYFSSMGKRSPSEGFFLESTIRPYRFFSFRVNASTDKNLSVSSSTQERIPVCREGIRLDITPEGKISVFGLYRRIGDALLPPGKEQIKTGAEYRFIREFSVYSNYTLQKSKSSLSHSVRGGIQFMLLKYFNGGVQGGFSLVDSKDLMYDDSLALDAENRTWMAVSEKTWNAAARIGFFRDFFSGTVRYGITGQGKTVIKNKVEFKASGRW